MNSRRAQEALQRALNGDVDSVDAPVRRGLVSNAVSTDEATTEIVERFEHLEERMESHFAAAAVRSTRLTALVGTLVVSIIVALIIELAVRF